MLQGASQSGGPLEQHGSGGESIHVHIRLGGYYGKVWRWAGEGNVGMSDTSYPDLAVSATF